MPEMLEFKSEGYVTVPNTGNRFIWYSTEPYVIREEQYIKVTEDGEQTITVSIMSDGTVHVEPGAFKLMMERMGFDERLVV